MEHVVRTKAKKHKDYQRNMLKRINDLSQKSLSTIRAIPSSAGEIWSKERLLQEFELKKRDLLNVKSCKRTEIWFFAMGFQLMRHNTRYGDPSEL
jgi:hypothetical protein